MKRPRHEACCSRRLIDIQGSSVSMLHQQRTIVVKQHTHSLKAPWGFNP
jgi:hypothetical protein